MGLPWGTRRQHNAGQHIHSKPSFSQGLSLSKQGWDERMASEDGQRKQEEDWRKQPHTRKSTFFHTSLGLYCKVQNTFDSFRTERFIFSFL